MAAAKKNSRAKKYTPSQLIMRQIVERDHAVRASLIELKLMVRDALESRATNGADVRDREELLEEIIAAQKAKILELQKRCERIPKPKKSWREIIFQADDDRPK